MRQLSRSRMPSIRVRLRSPAEARSLSFANASNRPACSNGRRRGYYAWKAALTLTVTAAGTVAFVLLGNSWWQLAVAVSFAVMFTQIGFLGHDIGHRQVFAAVERQMSGACWSRTPQSG